MPSLTDLAAPVAGISEEDRLAQTAKLFERTFGRPAADLGELKMLDGTPSLTFTHNGTAHILTWERDRNSAVVFRVDGDIVPGIGGEGSALRLVRWIDTK